MRAKHILSCFNVRRSTKLVWERITFSRITTAYFIVTVLHLVVQVILQIRAFSINAAAANTLWSLVEAANMTNEDNGFAILSNDLRICYTLPPTISKSNCTLIWTESGEESSSNPYAMDAVSLSPPVPASTPAKTEPTIPVTSSLSVISTQRPSSPVTTEASPTFSEVSVLSAQSVTPSSTIVLLPSVTPGESTSVVIAEAKDDNENQGQHGNGDKDKVLHSRFLNSKRTIEVTPSSINDTPGVIVHGLPKDFAPGIQLSATGLQLTDTCFKTLIWPVQRLSNTKREDITLIGFQAWVFGMSMVALLNESIPHVVTALVTHLLATVWTTFQIFATDEFRKDFVRLTVNGACKPHNLLGNYWVLRRNAEISSAVLNGAALLVSIFLTYKLIKIYGWQTFKRVGASITINRIYKLVLSLSIAIQLALFFIVAAAALWIDQLYAGSIGRMAALSSVYKGGIIALFCLLLPWLSLGWFANRLEMRKSSLVFLILNLLFVALWAAMFKSVSFRWTFVLWPFFAVMAVASGSLIIMTFILGLLCRINFGKGLSRYLNAQEPLQDENFTPVYPAPVGDDPEKVDFPVGRPVPTYSASFGKGSDVARPAQMYFGPSHGSETDMYGAPADYHGHSVTRSVSSTSSGSTRTRLLMRMDSTSSQISDVGSMASSGRTETTMGKRLVIE